MPRMRKSRAGCDFDLMRRFPIQEEVRYKCLKGSRTFAIGVGKTLEVGSRQLCFTTEQPLKLNQRLEITMNWPARLDSTCLMKLVILGRVISSEPESVVVRIDRHEFRTRAAKPIPSPGFSQAVGF
jgi:hypothetical protein